MSILKSVDTNVELSYKDFIEHKNVQDDVKIRQFIFTLIEAIFKAFASKVDLATAETMSRVDTDHQRYKDRLSDDSFRYLYNLHLDAFEEICKLKNIIDYFELTSLWDKGMQQSYDICKRNLYKHLCIIEELSPAEGEEKIEG